MNEFIKQWRNNAEADYKGNLDFLEGHRKNDRVDTVGKVHTDVFEELDCLDCANCCKTTPAMITMKDAKRAGKFLNMPPKTFLRKYTIEDIRGGYVFQKVPCVFLAEDNTCSIYEARPEACRRYPHTDEAEFFNRPRLNAQNTIVCPAAYAIVSKLKELL